MTKYVDLHLCVPWNNMEKLGRMIRKASELGYGAVGIPFPANSKADEMGRLRGLCREVGVDFVSRVDLFPKHPSELLASLRRLRRRFEVVSVTCMSKPVARQAAKDRRVDLLTFPVDRPRNRFFDSAEAELASESLPALEIDLAPLLLFEGYARIRLISTFRRELAIAKSFHVPVVFSSGATDDSPLRMPHDYAALAMLFDVDSSSALKSMSEVPMRIVERNRVKLSPDFVAPGLRVVRRGSDP